MDGYCAGEPWNALAIKEKAGFTVATSQDIWPDHPEKVLACSRDFADQKPDQARALILAVLEAARYLDTSRGRAEAAHLLAGPDFINVPVDLIEDRLQGRYQNGLGRAWQDPHPMSFFADGEVGLPWLSDGMWFLTQHYRWGMLAEHPDYLGVARRVNRLDLYRQAASQLGLVLPAPDTRHSTLMDGRPWDGSDPAGYAAGFALQGNGWREAA